MWTECSPDSWRRSPAVRPIDRKEAKNHSTVRHSNPSTSSRTGMHDRGCPPAPPRFLRSACPQLMMTYNDGIGDVSTIQTTPPLEIQLTAPIQEIHKMIADQTTLTTLASHKPSPKMLRPLFSCTAGSAVHRSILGRNLTLRDSSPDRSLSRSMFWRRPACDSLPPACPWPNCGVDGVSGRLIETPTINLCRFRSRDRRGTRSCSPPCIVVPQS